MTKTIRILPVIGLLFLQISLITCQKKKEDASEIEATGIIEAVKTEIKARPLAMIGGALAKPAFNAIGKKLDYREFGGGALLGVDGVVIIGHGRSDAYAVRNAIRAARQAVESDVIGAIKNGLTL
jgi:glycerol-3-phosphate acyltransferase PlsX